MVPINQLLTMDVGEASNPDLIITHNGCGGFFMITLCIMWEGTNRKYALDRLALLSLWPMQVGINFIQIEVVALEKVGFLFSKNQDVSSLIRLRMTCLHP
jgi:hypothetical protein